MQALTQSRLQRLDNNGYTVYRFGKHHAFVQKWSKCSSMLKARFSIYVLVKIIEEEYK